MADGERTNAAVATVQVFAHFFSDWMERLSFALTTLLGAIAGFTLFLGLPIARFKVLSKTMQGALNAGAVGIIVFLLWDILGNAVEPIHEALPTASHGDAGTFALLLALFVGGLALGLLSLPYVNRLLRGRAADPTAQPAPRRMALTIAGGLGLHNLSEGLAIGQAAASGALAFAGVLIVGFALHNMSEGFGIAAPLTLENQRPSWGFLLGAGLLGGSPTFIGTMIGYVASSTPVSVLSLAMAAGALIYVLSELFSVTRRLSVPTVAAWGVLVGFLAAFGSDLVLSAFAA